MSKASTTTAQKWSLNLNQKWHTRYFAKLQHNRCKKQDYGMQTYFDSFGYKTSRRPSPWQWLFTTIPSRPFYYTDQQIFDVWHLRDIQTWERHLWYALSVYELSLQWKANPAAQELIRKLITSWTLNNECHPFFQTEQVNFTTGLHISTRFSLQEMRQLI